ncbi:MULTISPECIES: ABC transporter permease [unclassified Bradyrhizobium]|uniref:ABC transporter permease n=1 Tax=unclassified Bradyrhizobium TaxID=2631580 RepID=UPI001CD6ED1F|nr:MULTISPECIES: ABC transporter permease [unclassified Bradyrhizobium]MCA1386418.1 ABC transporter permease [Bradyrhizobium sp. BRP05]MCA1394521.1 ABC transporter permease [Bradyrhizobium sp. IC3123]MCA1424014.1 ABC transporter permease [Bradyrhizobium sp. BRP23]MCA1431036.1 ABC transporter permease [Bradyrhizobium sp. NBAIM16]MCA1436371.1 ABC transporter permease [Bradyrhizobium sp. BRP20]
MSSSFSSSISQPASSLVWQRLQRNPVSFAALCVIVLIAAAAILAPIVAPYPPDATDPAASLQPPSWQHALGTDEFGRDQLSRIIFAARVDLLVAFAATFVAVSIGGLLGAVVGYSRGWADTIAMRVVDALMAFPAFVLAMGITAGLGNSTTNVAIAISITQIPAYLRLTRGEMLRLREMEYADAARTLGNPTWRIVFIHLLPNCLPPLIVQATLSTGFALLTMASLSFIGLGIQPPQSEWGVMTAEGASQIVTGEWWLFLFPGLAIMISVLAFNLIGDGLRDLLDPRMRGLR